MNYTCTHLGCPTRDAVAAEAPPVCYTCGRAMEATVVYDTTMPKLRTASVALVDHGPNPQCRVVDLGDNPTREAIEALGFSADSEEYRKVLRAFMEIVSQASTISISAPEPTPQQRAERTLGPISVTVERQEIADPEAFAATVQQAILRAMKDPRPDPAWGESILKRVTAVEPPYAVGEAVEWTPKPFGDSWTPGRVTSVIVDRPDDGIDKPFWVIEVDTAIERRFVGPVIPTCLRRPSTAS